MKSCRDVTTNYNIGIRVHYLILIWQTRSTANIKGIGKTVIYSRVFISSESKFLVIT